MKKAPARATPAFAARDVRCTRVGPRETANPVGRSSIFASSPIRDDWILKESRRGNVGDVEVDHVGPIKARVDFPEKGTTPESGGGSGINEPIRS